jgi:hypothetical protein
MQILHYVRVGIISTVTLASALLLLYVVLHSIVAPVVVLLLPSWETFFYDLGFYGAYPTRVYTSFNLTSPAVSQKRWSDRCEDGYVFLTPKGPSVPHVGPTILDKEGNLIWMSNQYKTATNLKVQHYQGKPYLTFWSGKQAGTAGAGEYYMLDDSYNVVRTVTPVGADIHGDLHEFRITDEGTALMTIYNKTNMDMRDWGRSEHGWILDSVFQEVDIETGNLLFEWRASEHYNVSETYDFHPLAGYTSWIPFDFFHINSVDKDKHGNYLISSRHMHTLTYIDGKTGETLWILGGKRNDFKDISDGKAITFSWQHDARWLNREEGIISLFDNRQAGVFHTWASSSRGLMLQIDENRRTVKLLQEFESYKKTIAPSQGSLEILPESSNVFIGWGHSGLFTEFASDGELLCETHFSASIWYWWGEAVSYRSFKTKDWIGKPKTKPSVALQDSKLWVSWNGATEVGAWQLEGMGLEDGEYRSLDVIEKHGFEEMFSIANSDSYVKYRVAALTSDWKVIEYSEAVENTPRRTISGTAIKVIVGCVFALVGVYCFRRFVRPRIGERMRFTWSTALVHEYRMVPNK